MKLGFKRGQKGFTLVELMVVMAIMAVLAAIVIPAVTGTKQVSVDSQVKQDASAMESSIGSYNADANAAENLSTNTSTPVVGENTTQIKSNKWPEKWLTEVYSGAFPQATTIVTSVTIKDTDGTTTLYATGGTNDLADFVADYKALDTGILLSDGYITEEPNGIDLLFSSSKAYHNYLWLLKKAAVGDDADGGRTLQVFSLTMVITSGSTDSLVYQRIY